MRQGILSPIDQIGNNKIYAAEDVERVKSSLYRDGLTHTEIGRLYGKTRNTVIYWFRTLGIEPDGRDRRQHRGPAVYDATTVQYVAEQLEWQLTDKEGWDKLETENE